MTQEKDDSITEDDLDKIIEDISAEETAATAPPANIETARKEKKPVSASSGKEQALTLELTGAINLKLCFASGERSIEVFCTEESLLCRMADGTEFRIPVGSAKQKNKAA